MEMNEDSSIVPWLYVLVQGVIDPQQLCVNFQDTDLVLRGNVPNMPGVTWQMQIVLHRFAVAFTVDHPLPFDIDPLVDGFRNDALNLVSLWLRAQAIESRTRLEWGTYTIAVQVNGVLAEPRWVQLLSQSSPKPIPNDALRDVADAIMPALHNLDLQYAIRDYDLALKYSGGERLIFLWRAAEQILLAYHEPTPGDTPKYERAANALGLFYRESDERGLWVRELAQLAHRKARHAGGMPPSPGELLAAEERVAEMIRRHARFRQGNETWARPKTDTLTGSVKPLSGSN
jgi:hypothetical protein